MATVAVLGTGYVGLVTALALVSRGHRLFCVDTDAAKVDSLNRGEPTFHEEGVSEALRGALASRLLTAATDGVAAVRESEVTFLCVGTPARPDGSMDDRPLREAARAVGRGLVGHRGRPLVVVRSTVLPGTTESVVLPEIEQAAGPNAPAFDLVVSPEFFQEGTALKQALQPDRLVVGERDVVGGDGFLRLHTGYDGPVLRCDWRTAEMVKYATNAFLATKISFANEVANLCALLGADYDRVLEGLALDPRINPRHMVPGLGFGGSCLPKDVSALRAAAEALGYDPALLDAVTAVNDRQPLRAVELLEQELGSLRGRRIAILGMAFKAGTDDVRESRAIPLAKELMKRGAAVVGYDPVAASAFSKVVPEVKVVGSVAEALAGADACVVQAAWPEVRRLSAADFAGMANPLIVDGRRALDPKELDATVKHRRLG